MTTKPGESSSQELSIAEVLTYPLEMDVEDDFPGNYAFTRRGVGVEVVLQDNDEPIYTKEVWQRGTWLPRPFYERRLVRALDKASKLAGALSVKYSNSL